MHRFCRASWTEHVGPCMRVVTGLGVLTPMPCIPVIPAPWVPGSPTVLIANKPALNNSSKLMCAWGGVISINNPGQMKHQIP